MNISIVGCYVKNEEGKFLLLRRAAHKSDGGLWGIPAGKIEANEQPLNAVLREVSEETGLQLDPSEVKPLKVFSFNFDGNVFGMEVFGYSLSRTPEIKINPNEHQDFAWVDLQEVGLKYQPMRGLNEICAFLQTLL